MLGDLLNSETRPLTTRTRRLGRSLILAAAVAALTFPAGIGGPVQTQLTIDEDCACALFGTRVAPGDREPGYPLTAGFPFSPHYLDDGDATFELGEPVYVKTQPENASISPGDVRVTNAPGSVVRAGDADEGQAATLLGGGWRFHDADGNDVYTARDHVYWDTDESGNVTANDIRFTPTPAGAAGTVVASGDADVGQGLDVAFLSLQYVDLDRDAIFTAADALYLSETAGVVFWGDVRASGRPTRLVAEPLPSGQSLPAFRAKLTDNLTGAPIQERTISFIVDGRLMCTAPTNGLGLAACGSHTQAARAKAAGGYFAVFDGSAPHCGSEGIGPPN